jgi:hypothetical protein
MVHSSSRKKGVLVKNPPLVGQLVTSSPSGVKRV